MWWDSHRGTSSYSDVTAYVDYTDVRIDTNGVTFVSKWFSFVFLQLSKTNFSNNNDFRSFLQSLCATFKEFKMHEQIENEYIIGLLQQRCCTVYNVHSDNKLSEMLSLFEKGLHSVKVNMCRYFTVESFYILMQQRQNKPLLPWLLLILLKVGCFCDLLIKSEEELFSLLWLFHGQTQNEEIL